MVKNTKNGEVRKKETNVLDLFCGAGGFAQGFKTEGFSVTGVDISDYAGKTFEINQFGLFQQTDLSKNLIRGSFDVIVGGPPCKPWSAVNTTRRGKSHRDYVLLARFFKHIQANLPRVFLLENVPLLAGEPALKRYITRLREEYGYSIESKVLKYSDYGAPTRRRRFLLYGTRVGEAQAFFDQLLTNKIEARTVKDAIWEVRFVRQRFQRV